MSKQSSAAKTNVTTEDTPKREARTSAPVANSKAQEQGTSAETSNEDPAKMSGGPVGDVVNTDKTDGEHVTSLEPVPELAPESGHGAGEARAEDAVKPKTGTAVTTGKSDVKGDISVSGTKAATTKEPAKPRFEVKTEERAKLFGMTDEQLLEGIDLKAVEASDRRVFQIDPTNQLKDMIVGSDLERSGIRAAVIHFLRTRENDAAEGRVIIAYMKRAAGIGHGGKFDIGYLAARGSDVKRGMVSRGQLRIIGNNEAPKTDAKAETPKEDAKS